LVAAAIPIGIHLAVLAGREARESRLLRVEGIETNALVTRLWRARGEGKQPWVAYRFTIQGRTYEREAKAPLQVWKNLRVGAELPVRYVASDPEINQPPNINRRATPIWLPFAVSGALAAAGLLTMRVLQPLRRLLSSGRAAPGLVVQHMAMERSTHGRERGRKFQYEFPLLSGAIARGVSGPSKNPPAIGSIICVLYDPDNPRKNAPYPLSLVRPAGLRGR
jgi:hypothetical protein